MSKINIPLDGHLNVPFQLLKNDPLLVLKKFPFLETLEAHGPMNYFVVTVPLALTNTIKVRRRWHINLEVLEDRILWKPVEEDHAADGCDGWIAGEIVDVGNGRVRVTLNASMEHRLLNTITTAIYRNAINQTGYNFLQAFERNFRDTAFQNQVPVWTN